MHLSLTLLAVIPGAALLLLGVWGAFGIGRTVKESRPVQAGHCLALMAFLLTVDVGASLVILVSAGLSHSEAAKSRAPVYCFILFVLIVLLPAFAITWLYRRNRKV